MSVCFVQREPNTWGFSTLKRLKPHDRDHIQYRLFMWGELGTRKRFRDADGYGHAQAGPRESCHVATLCGCKPKVRNYDSVPRKRLTQPQNW